MKKVVLALLVVLTAASVSFAGYTPVITEVDNGVTGYETYLISLTVDDPGGITSVSNMAVEGNAVQMKYWVGFPTNAWFDTTGPIAAGSTGYELDTHIIDNSGLSTTGEGYEFVGQGWVEDNDETLTTALGGTAGAVEYGLGELYLKSETSPSTLAIKNPPAGLMTLDVIQVCFPTGEGITVSGVYTNADRAAAQLPMVPFSYDFNGGAGDVPEPSTIVLLVMGALCLVGLRRRK